MKKDVIYIDTEDDITSIIDKVKGSSEKIVALVPPKRVGVLQSAVNLKLLQKSAKNSDKRIVIITGNKSLSALAAGVAIPVAKTLQSKPELAQTGPAPELDNGEEDIIEGEDLPVGEHAKTSPTPEPTDLDDETIELPEDLAAEPEKGPKKSKSKAKKNGPNIPNFDTFRKKLFIAIGAGIFLVVFLIWAFFFAPHATVNIKANTTSEDVNAPVALTNSGSTDIGSRTLASASQQEKKTFSTDFDATGKKDTGNKATGSVTISNRDSSDSIYLPAGTAVSSNGLNFMTASSVTVPGVRVVGGQIRPGTASIAVQAQNVGEDYNLSSGSTFTVAGQSSQVSAVNSSALTGGSKRTVTVVSDSDINSAKDQIIEQNSEAGRKDLESKFDSKKYIVIDKSYKAEPTNVTSSPASGSEASRARLSVEITYTLTALDKSDVSDMLNAYLKDKIKDGKNQKVYDNGIGNLQFDNFSDASVTLKTTGYIGPNIDTKNLKPQLVGKNYEEIRQIVKALDSNVQDVDTRFFPFWVSTAPGQDKIDIKFVVKKDD